MSLFQKETHGRVAGKLDRSRFGASHMIEPFTLSSCSTPNLSAIQVPGTAR
jgi:hypothetical protein